MLRHRIVIAFILLCAPGLAVDNIAVSNTASYIGNGQYNWTVFLVADPGTLAQVARVRYTLHPSFPQPIRWGNGPRFECSAVGWGEFNIVATVYFKSPDRKPQTYNYWLHLRTPA
jgi:transcription initiation factor IIF auxiliary subunit